MLGDAASGVKRRAAWGGSGVLPARRPAGAVIHRGERQRTEAPTVLEG